MRLLKDPDWASRGRNGAGSALLLPLPPTTATGSTSADEFISVATAAAIMSIDKHTVRNWIRAGRLAAHRPERHGAAWRIARREIEALQQTKQGESVSELADWYCVAEGTVRRWIRTGRLQRERANQRGFFRTSDAGPRGSRSNHRMQLGVKQGFTANRPRSLIRRYVRLRTQVKEPPGVQVHKDDSRHVGNQLVEIRGSEHH